MAPRRACRRDFASARVSLPPARASEPWATLRLPFRIIRVPCGRQHGIRSPACGHREDSPARAQAGETNRCSIPTPRTESNNAPLARISSPSAGGPAAPYWPRSCDSISPIGVPTSRSVYTLRQAGFFEAKARSNAGPISSDRSTRSPCPPRASAIFS